MHSTIFSPHVPAAVSNSPFSTSAFVLKRHTSFVALHRLEEQPDSSAGRLHTLAGVDYQASSALLFRGHDALHRLVEFLMNTRAGAAPFFLTLQMLSPRPFLNGSAYWPRLVHQAARAAPGTPDATLHVGEALRLEDAERGGGAVLMPGVLRRITEVRHYGVYSPVDFATAIPRSHAQPDREMCCVATDLAAHTIIGI